MGGVEVKEWKPDVGSVEGTVDTGWLYPVSITAVFPAENNGFIAKKITLHPNQKRFRVVSSEE